MSIISPSINRKRGPRFKVSRAQAQLVKSDYERNEKTVEEIARGLGVTKQTIYNVLSRLRREAVQPGEAPHWA